MLSENLRRSALNLFFPTDIYCAACGNLIDGTRPYALCDRCVRDIDWHMGATCTACGKALAPHRTGGVCRECREQGRAFDAGISCCTYSGRARDIVHAMKYNDSAWIAEKLADAMYDRLIQLQSAEALRSPAPSTLSPNNQQLCDSTPATQSPSDLASTNQQPATPPPNDPTPSTPSNPSPNNPSPYNPAPNNQQHRNSAARNLALNNAARATPPPKEFTVVPVPMTKAKRSLRGYDQAAVIARRLAQLAGAPFANDMLRRKRDTAVMSELGAYDRRANMEDAFEAGPYFQKLLAAGMQAPREVMLVDDVFTTGSTADACAATLKEAGVRRVILFTFASGPDSDNRSRKGL
jgi:predicted amidophosphoribosyltransferase